MEPLIISNKTSKYHTTLGIDLYRTGSEKGMRTELKFYDLCSAYPVDVAVTLNGEKTTVRDADAVSIVINGEFEYEDLLRMCKMILSQHTLHRKILYGGDIRYAVFGVDREDGIDDAE
jgi:hypothetical protein